MPLALHILGCILRLWVEQHRMSRIESWGERGWVRPTCRPWQSKAEHEWATMTMDRYGDNRLRVIHKRRLFNRKPFQNPEIMHFDDHNFFVHHNDWLSKSSGCGWLPWARVARFSVQENMKIDHISNHARWACRTEHGKCLARPVKWPVNGNVSDCSRVWPAKPSLQAEIISPKPLIWNLMLWWKSRESTYLLSINGLYARVTQSNSWSLISTLCGRTCSGVEQL